MAQDHEPTVAVLGMHKTESTWRGEEGSVSCFSIGSSKRSLFAVGEAVR